MPASAGLATAALPASLLVASPVALSGGSGAGSGSASMPAPLSPLAIWYAPSGASVGASGCPSLVAFSPIRTLPEALFSPFGAHVSPELSGASSAFHRRLSRCTREGRCLAVLPLPARDTSLPALSRALRWSILGSAAAADGQCVRSGRLPCPSRLLPAGGLPCLPGLCLARSGSALPALPLPWWPTAFPAVSLLRCYPQLISICLIRAFDHCVR